MAETQHNSVDTYPERFQTYIAWSVEHILQSVPQDDAPLPATVRGQALHVLSFALELEHAWPTTRTLLLAIAPKMEQAGYRDEWIPYVEKGIQLSQIIHDKRAIAELRSHLGFLYRLQGRLDDACETLESSSAIFQFLNAHDSQAKALSRLAFVKHIQGQFEEAQRLGQMALELSESRSQTAASVHAVLGVVTIEKNDSSRAYHHFLRALDIWRVHGVQRMVAWSLGDLGACRWIQKDHENAIASFEEALTLFEQVHDPIQSSAVQMNLGIVYVSIGKYHEALEKYLLAKSTFYQAGDKLRLAQVNNNIGFVYQNLELWTQAEKAYQESITQWRTLGNTLSLVNVLDGLGMVYLGQELSKAAAESFFSALQLLAEVEETPQSQHVHNLIMKHLNEAQRKSRF